MRKKLASEEEKLTYRKIKKSNQTTYTTREKNIGEKYRETN